MKKEFSLPLLKVATNDARCRSDADCNACLLGLALGARTESEFLLRASGLKEAADKSTAYTFKRIEDLNTSNNLLTICPRITIEAQRAHLHTQIESHLVHLNRKDKVEESMCS
jgi:hypothetical protein